MKRLLGDYYSQNTLKKVWSLMQTLQRVPGLIEEIDQLISADETVQPTVSAFYIPKLLQEYNGSKFSDEEMIKIYVHIAKTSPTQKVLEAWNKNVIRFRWWIFFSSPHAKLAFDAISTGQFDDESFEKPENKDLIKIKKNFPVLSNDKKGQLFDQLIKKHGSKSETRNAGRKKKPRGATTNDDKKHLFKALSEDSALFTYPAVYPKGSETPSLVLCTAQQLPGLFPKLPDSVETILVWAYEAASKQAALVLLDDKFPLITTYYFYIPFAEYVSAPVGSPPIKTSELLFFSTVSPIETNSDSALAQFNVLQKPSQAEIPPSTVTSQVISSFYRRVPRGTLGLLKYH